MLIYEDSFTACHSLNYVQQSMSASSGSPRKGDVITDLEQIEHQFEVAFPD